MNAPLATHSCSPEPPPALYMFTFDPCLSSRAQYPYAHGQALAVRGYHLVKELLVRSFVYLFVCFEAGGCGC